MAQYALNKGGEGRGYPTPETWAIATAREGGSNGPHLSGQNKLLAWALSDPRAWEGHEMESLKWHASNHRIGLAEWAVQQDAWVLDALLSQPGRPELPQAWFEQQLGEAVLGEAAPGRNDRSAWVLFRHGGPGLAAARYRIEPGSSNPYKPDHPVPVGTGNPGLSLLHMAGDKNVVKVLLEQGIDPRVRDHKGRTADEFWKEREEGRLNLARNLSSYKVSPMMATLSAHLETTGDIDAPVVRRQDRWRFGATPPGDLPQWLQSRPAGLVLGENRVLPHQSLMAIEEVAASVSKRAVALLEHEDEAALARVGPGGVREGEALWWLVVAGGVKSHAAVLRREWPAMAEAGAWLSCLDVLDRLDAWDSVA